MKGMPFRVQTVQFAAKLFEKEAKEGDQLKKDVAS